MRRVRSKKGLHLTMKAFYFAVRKIPEPGKYPAAYQ
jgi:hypothetical protein